MKGYARSVAAVLQVGDEVLPFLAEIVEVGLTHPARQDGEVQLRVGSGFDRVDAYALLTGVTPFPANVLRLHGGGRHDQDKKLGRVDGLGELLPPTDSTLQENAVLPDDDIGGLLTQALAQRGGKLLAVFARVGERKTPLRWLPITRDTIPRAYTANQTELSRVSRARRPLCPACCFR